MARKKEQELDKADLHWTSTELGTDGRLLMFLRKGRQKFEGIVCLSLIQPYRSWAPSIEKSGHEYNPKQLLRGSNPFIMGFDVVWALVYFPNRQA